MSRALEHATARAWVALATMLGATLAILLPSLLTTTSHAAGSVTLAVLTLAFAALVRFGLRSVAFAARTKTRCLQPATRQPLCYPDGSPTRCTTRSAPVLLD